VARNALRGIRVEPLKTSVDLPLIMCSPVPPGNVGGNEERDEMVAIRRKDDILYAVMCIVHAMLQPDRIVAMFVAQQIPASPPLSLEWSLVWLAGGCLIAGLIILRLVVESSDETSE
jgi:hypothetical protein